jgi:hypothetical protein
MKKQIIFWTLSIMAVFALVSCGKDSYKEGIIGKWKLEKVTYSDLTEYINFSEIDDYSANNIIYEFRKNNKLVVTSSISGNTQTKEYSYKFENGENFCATFGISAFVKIGKENYKVYLGRGISDGTISSEFETMSIFGSSKPKNIIDESDTDIITKENLPNWTKGFIKLQ